MLKTKESIAEWLDKYEIVNYTINADLTVDVAGDVSLNNNYFVGRLPLNFGVVSGYFSCYENYLTSLAGCPEKVGDYFNCGKNRLWNLRGCPKYIGDYFSCDNNDLTSLVGCPTEIKNGFYCSDNRLESLIGGPVEVGGEFLCMNNKLVNLEGCPMNVGYDFYCSSNEISSFDYLPLSVGRFFFYDRDNPLLASMLPHDGMEFAEIKVFMDNKKLSVSLLSIPDSVGKKNIVSKL